MPERMNTRRMQQRLLRGNGYTDPDRPNRGWIRVLTELELRQSLIEVARRRNTSLSTVVREALWLYVTSEEHDDHRQDG